MVTGSRTVVSAVDVTPGQATAFTIGGLPLGNDSFSGEAFSAACAMLTPSAVAAWIGDRVVASVVVAPPVAVTLVLRRNGRATVGVDFQDDPDGGATGGASGSGGMTGAGGAGVEAGTGGAGGPGPITFAPPIIAPLQAQVGPMVSADFNHDGVGDLAFTTNNGGVFLMIASPMGIIGPIQQIAQISPGLRAIVAGDFDGNGFIDLAIALPAGNSPALLSAIGPGVFGPLTTLPVPSLAVLAAADGDGDGVTDIVGVTDTGAGFGLSQRLGTRQIFAGPSLPPSAIVVANLDGDAAPDVALLSGNGSTPITVVTTFLQGTGGNFLTGPATPIPTTSTALAAADFDGDGVTDLAAGGTGGAFLLTGLGGGGFAVRPVPSGLATALVAADFNGDGRPDLATLATSQVLVFRNLGAGMFDAPLTVTAGPAPLLGMITATLTPGSRPSLVVGSIGPVLALLRNTSP
jgi:hypothetical protein